MSDHDFSDSDDTERPTTGFSLSSVLFGNFDKDGELIDDFLGKETSKHLKSLDKDLTSGLIEEIKNDVQESIKYANEDKSNDKTESKNEVESNDFEKKVDDAVDYSDINEMVDDVQPEEDDTKFREALSELVFKMPTAPISKPTQQQKKLVQEDDDYDATDSDKQSTGDKPSTSSLDAAKKVQKENVCSNNKKRLDTPLAEMLPSKYEDCDVTELFPEFRPNQTLRFSRLINSTKSSLMPNLWKNVKNKKRKKKRQTSESATKEENNQNLNTEKESTESLTTSTAADKPVNKTFELKFAETVNENDVEEDQEEFLKRPLENLDYLNTDEDPNGDQKVAHWKNGPAAFWYKGVYKVHFNL